MSAGDQRSPLELNGTTAAAAAAAIGGGGGGGVVNGAENGLNGAPGEGATMNGGGGGGGGNDGGTVSPGAGEVSEEAGGTGDRNALDAGCSDGPPSIIGVGPPSPLTGCYLLIIIGEPHSQDHKDIILQRLIKGFLSWDVSDCHVDLEEELHTITLQALEGEEGKHGERLIQYASENLVTEILIHPQINTFIQCIRNLLSSFTRHRHIIHTGYTFAGNGSWVLQDGTFSVVDFMEAFQEHEVQRVLRAYPDTITMDVHCAPVGNWVSIQDKTLARLCRVRLNPVDVLSSGSDKLNAFVDYLASMIVPTEISELLESSDVVGNIRFSHPTLYVFPGGQGDAALFGINGFNMLVDGGFSRKSCFWDFVRHLDRLDAVLMTRINNTNIKGISAVVERKHEAHVYPQIGHFFTNIPERKGLLSPDGDKDRDPLLVDLIEEGHQIVTNLKSLNLKAQNCYRDAEPINLYHKVGHGTLDMYVISPAKDSKEVKEFLAKWHAADPKLFASKESKEFTFPIQNIISICALLVWTPANPEDNITRILFPGSAPEYKILEGLEKMKSVEFMRHPVCTVKSIAPSISTQAFTKKSLKSSSIDKIIPEPILPSKATKSLEKDNRIIDNKLNKMIDNKLVDSAKSSSDIMDSSADEAKLEKQLTKSTVATVATAKVVSKTVKSKSTESTKKVDNKLIETANKKIELDEKKDSASDAGSDKDETEKKVAAEEAEKKSDDDKDKKDDSSPTVKDESKSTKKISRPATARSRIDTKPPKATTKIIKKKDDTTKSSPTTPKKTVEPKLTNGVSAEKKDEETSKKPAGPPKTTKPVSTKPGKASPKSTPAKSAKDANNRKVLEARQRPVPKAPARKETTAAAEKKETPPKIERKPISRRPKGAASATAVGGSPVKAKKVLKSEKDAVIRKAKLDKNGTTDSSLVSTPSADEAGVAVQKRIADSAALAATSSAASSSDIDPIQQQQLAELKEEQEAVREIEAVFKRDSDKIKRRELLSEHREIQDSTTEPEEEDEYLIIEKEEQYTEDSINEPESSATKEEEIQKHQRDSEESEKRKRDSLEGEKEEKADIGKAEDEAAAVVEVIEGGEPEEDKPDDDKQTAEGETDAQEAKDEPKEPEKLSPKHKQDIEEEVQEIIASAKEIAKSKMETSMDGLKTEEMSSISPDDKISSTKKTSDTRDEIEPEPVAKEHIEPPHESHHEERVSATGESGATTTAPTLPEDERIPLDEIKEDLVIEEKHVKEETKEVEVAPPPPTVYEPLERPTPAKMQFSTQQAHMRDVVKTPDEVADLPMHEEADFEEYGDDKDKDDEKDRDTKEKPDAAEGAALKKETEEKQPEKTDKLVTDKSAESDKLCDTVKDAQEVQEVIEKVEKDTKVEKPPKLEPQASPAKESVMDEAAVLQDLESQIIPKEAEIKKQPDVAKVEATAASTTEATLAADEVDEDDKKSVHEEVIVPTKVESKVPSPSVLDEIWGVPAKAEQKLEELKEIIDGEAKKTTCDLVTMKDEMVKEIVERKEEVVAVVKAEAEETSADLQTKAEQLDDKVTAGIETVKTDAEEAAAKAEEVLSSIASEKKELEKLAQDIKQEVSEKLDETKKQLEDELNKTAEKAQETAKGGISSFFGGIADGIKSEIEKIADKVETKLKDKTDQVETKLQQVTDKIDELKGKQGVEAEVCVKKETGFEAPFGYERSFTQELRETHITTVDSPVSESDKMAELKSMVNIPQHIDEDKELEDLETQNMSGSFMIEEVKYSSFEDANLRDIKEEEEEDRTTPPQKDEKKSSTPKLEPFPTQPPRARTPEDVAKIVANVAEVLKSDKDLEEIIPGFDPQELERKLSQGTAREEDVSTVQRMLVTASSEDGGEETVICPAGTITFSKTATPEPPTSGKTTPEIKVEEETAVTDVKQPEKPSLPEMKQDEKSSPASSGKSSPDLKTSPTSIEEKDKHELPEKIVDAKKTPEKTMPEERKESIAEHFIDHIDDSRRESAISTFSERDYTKDESSFVDERDSSRAHSISSHISDLKEDAADAKSIAEFLKESEKVDEKQDIPVDAAKAKESTKKTDDLSSPESVTSQKTVSEKSPIADGTAEAKPDDKAASRPESAASEKPPSEKSPAVESKLEIAKETSRPTSAASEKAPSEKSAASEAEKADSKEPSQSGSVTETAPEKSPVVERKQDSKESSRPESVASHASEKAPSDKADAKEASRPESAASHVSDKAQVEKVSNEEKSRPESAASHVSEKAPSDVVQPVKEPSRPDSVASHISEKAPSEKVDEKASRPESAASHHEQESVKAQAEDKLSESKEASRPASAISDKATSEKSVESGKADEKDASRPASVASTTADKQLTADSKEPSRPESAASHMSDKEEAKAEEKESSRPVSAAPSDQLDAKEASRPTSAASHVSEKEVVLDATAKSDEKQASRPESAASHISETAPAKSEAKAESRSESVASHVSDKAASEKSETSTKEVAGKPEIKGDASETLSKVEEKTAEKDVPHPESAATQETSRPESVASHISEKGSSETQVKSDEKKASRPASAASAVSEKAASDKSAILDKPSEKEASRPESAASHVSEQASTDKAAASEEKTEDKEASRPVSAASHVSEKAASEKSATQEKQEASRPESAASHVSEKAASEKSATLEKPSEQETSRPTSAASHVSEKAASEKSATLEKTAEHEASRPESVASHVSEKAPSDKSATLEKPSEQEASRPASAASHVSEKAASEKSATLEKQEASRPDSAASHVSEKATSEKTEDKEASRPVSAASHVSEAAASEKSANLEKPDEKQASRPESAVSQISDKSPSDKPATDEKQASRPESVASHVSEKAASEEKPASRPESVVSHVSETAASDKSTTQEKIEEKASSRPESAASHVSEKQDAKEASRPESVASHVSEKPTSDKSPSADKAEEKPKDESRPESVASHVSEKAAEESDEKVSRPASQASAVEDKSPAAEKAASEKDSSRPASVASDKTKSELQVDGKAESRPESAASQVSEKEQSKSPAQELKTDAKEAVVDSSRPESVASHASDKASADEKAASDKDASRKESIISQASEKDASRPVSVASHVSEKDSIKVESEKDASRPASAASHVSEKVVSEPEKTTSRPESATSHVSAKTEDAEKDAKEASRPQSSASHVSEKDKKADEKEASRPESAASHATSDKSPAKNVESAIDDKASTKDDKASRPESVASDKTSEAKHTADGDFSRPDSPASCSSDKVIASKEPESGFFEKDLARRDSNDSYHGEPIPDEKTFSRPESPDSCAEDKDKDVPKDVATEKVAEVAKDKENAATEQPSAPVEDFSRPDSPASCGDEKELSSKAPESSVPEKDLARPDSAASYHGEAIPGEKQFSRPDSPASTGEEVGEVKVDSKEASEKSRPESAASHVSESKSPCVEESKATLTADKAKSESSRPESAASHVSEKSSVSEKASLEQQSRRESATKEDRPTSALSDHTDDGDDKVVLKETRSKSLSAVMATTTQRSVFEGSALGVLEETMVTSRDDLHVLKTPRESITKIEPLPEKVEPKVTKPLFGDEQFPADGKKESNGFPVIGSEHESPDETDSIIPGVDVLLKETASSMKEIEKMSTTVISMIKTSEKKDETTKHEEKSSTLSFPLLDSGKSTPMSMEKDKSQASSIKSVSPHEKDSLEGSSASLNTFIEKDSLSESTTKQVTIKMSTVEESSSTAVTTSSSKVECTELLGGTKTPPTAPISPNVVREDFSLGHQLESTVASSTTTTVTSSSSQFGKQHKEDVSGISTPKESVPSGKSSPGLMSVHTGSTDSASKSINLGHSSGIETSESSPKPTSPFPKVVDTLKTDEVKTSSGMSTPDMTRTSTPDMVDSQIERIPEGKTGDTMVTTTTTTKTTKFIIKDGEKIEVGSTVKTETATDTKKDDTSSAGESMSTSSVTTITTTKPTKEAVKTPAVLTLSSTEDRSLTDDYDDKEAMSPRSDISSGQASRIVAGWHDEDVPGSPMSVTSQAPLSPSTKYTYDYDLQHSSSGVSKKSDIEIDDSQDEIPPQYGSEEVKSAITIASAYKPDPMSTSFYGQLPDISDTSKAASKSVPIPIAPGKASTKTYMEYASSGESSVDSSHHKTSTSERKYLDEADMDFEKTFSKPDLMTTSMHFSSEKEFMAATTTSVASTTTVADSSKKELDFTASGLPSTSTTIQQQQQAQSTTQQSSSTTVTSTSSSSSSNSSATITSSSSSTSQQSAPQDPLASWGKPLGLPSPAPLNDADNKSTTPKKERKMIISKTKLNNEKNLRKRSESPIKAQSKKPAPVYVDLSYVPHHGNSYYANVEFFKRVRARYYVFSGTEPSREVYNALLEAKQTWEDKDLEVTIIPTYDTDVLGYWVSENEDLLAKYHIDLSPSAARCTINLQDHETSCSAYRLEF